MKKYLIGFIMGAFIFGALGVIHAEYKIFSRDVSYKETNVELALDELYSKSNINKQNMFDYVYEIYGLSNNTKLVQLIHAYWGNECKQYSIDKVNGYKNNSEASCNVVSDYVETKNTGTFNTLGVYAKQSKHIIVKNSGTVVYDGTPTVGRMIYQATGGWTLDIFILDN